MRSIYLEYSRHKRETTWKEYAMNILDNPFPTRYRKWVDIFQVYIGIFQIYRPSGHMYGIFQEYVRESRLFSAIHWQHDLQLETIQVCSEK